MTRRIDDKSFWAGKPGKDDVFPMGVHQKAERSAGGAGGLNDYPDTTEAILREQEMGQSKIHAHAIKSGYRN